MVNFLEFLLGLGVAIALAALIILITGLIHNKNGYVSVIEKKHEFYKIEISKFSWYMPLVYRKVAYYPTIEKTKKINNKLITFYVSDPMKLYKSKKKIKDIISDVNISSDDLLNKFGIIIINK